MSIGRIRSFIRRVLLERASPEFILYLKHLQSPGDSEIPFERRAVVYESVSRKRILVLAPHPDDEAVGLGGTLCMHLAAGSDVTVLYMTGGGLADPREDPSDMTEMRRAEAKAVGAAYGLRQVFWETRDMSLEADSDTVKRLGDLLREIRPDAVFVPSPIDAHRDHFVANRILVGALDDTDACDVEVFGYEIWTDIPFPNHVIDITEVFEKKLEMIAYYLSQTALCDYQSLCRAKNALNHLRHVHCLKGGYAEAFVRFSADVYRDVVPDPSAARRP